MKVMLKLKELHRKDNSQRYSVRETLINPAHIIKMNPVSVHEHLIPNGLEPNVSLILISMNGSTSAIVVETIESLLKQCSSNKKELLLG